jgi:hypothetical protein
MIKGKLTGTNLLPTRAADKATDGTPSTAFKKTGDST